ncbi:MAG TPA: type II secretion system F family protein [Gaiellaceae bacterium]|jgi:tight adherence protein C
MILVLFIGLVFTAAAVSLVVRSLFFSRLYAERTLRQISSYRLSEDGPELRETELDSRSLALRPVIDSLANRVGGLSGSEERLRKLLLATGLYKSSPRRYAGYQTLAALAGAFVWLLLMLGSGPASMLAILSAAVLILGGWSAPMLILRRRARERARRIDREMPALIDMLVTTVEAGLGFATSLQMASRRFQKSALGEELRLTLREQSMGLSLRDALDHMVERQNTPAIRSFVRSIVQGEQMGISVGQTLRNLSAEMRARYRQQIEEQAHKAPVKLIFPLVLFIFPSLFIVMLGPAAIRIYEVFIR